MHAVYKILYTFFKKKLNVIKIVFKGTLTKWKAAVKLIQENFIMLQNIKIIKTTFLAQRINSIIADEFE